jgi:hypothetical protein
MNDYEDISSNGCDTPRLVIDEPVTPDEVASSQGSHQQGGRDRQKEAVSTASSVKVEMSVNGCLTSYGGSSGNIMDNSARPANQRREPEVIDLEAQQESSTPSQVPTAENQWSYNGESSLRKKKSINFVKS